MIAYRFTGYKRFSGKSSTNILTHLAVWYDLLYDHVSGAYSGFPPPPREYAPVTYIFNLSLLFRSYMYIF